jgi:hypothetical protein
MSPLQYIGLAVDGGIALLDATIVAASEQLTVAVEEGCADRDATLRKPQARFGDGNIEHCLEGCLAHAVGALE